MRSAVTWKASRSGRSTVIWWYPKTGPNTCVSLESRICKSEFAKSTAFPLLGKRIEYHSVVARPSEERAEMGAKPSVLMLNLLSEMPSIKHLDEDYEISPKSESEAREFTLRQERRKEIGDQIKSLGSQQLDTRAGKA